MMKPPLGNVKVQNDDPSKDFKLQRRKWRGSDAYSNGDEKKCVRVSLGF